MLTESQIDQIIGPVTGGLIAILTGVLVSYMGYRLTTNGERLKSLNLALFHLFRAHRYAEFKLQLDTEDLFETVWQQLGRSADSSDRVRSINPDIVGSVDKHLGVELESLNPNQFDVEFKLAMRELSKVEPELAYQIDLRSGWQASLDNMAAYLDSTLPPEMLEGEALSLANELKPRILKIMADAILKDLRSDLLSVARCISYWKYRAIKNMIRELSKTAKGDPSSKLVSDELMEQMNKALAEGVQAAIKTNSNAQEGGQK